MNKVRSVRLAMIISYPIRMNGILVPVYTLLLTKTLPLQGKQSLSYSLITEISQANQKARNAITEVKV